MEVRRLAQRFQNFKGGSLLALNSDRVDGVYHLNLFKVRHLTDQIKGVVKVP